jgi:uncharacterized membrane protein YedE/YeeE
LFEELTLQNGDDKGWSPYLAGALSGVVLVLSVLISGKYFGASTSFVRSAGILEKLVDPERVAKVEYFARTAPVIDWQWMFVLGILIGSFISAITSGSFRLKALPDMWHSRFGPSIAKRSMLAFVGGAILLFGARLAGG